MIFSEMLCKTLEITPDIGELEGDCCICQKHTTTGFKKKFSGNFTCANYISHGEVICPECNYFAIRLRLLHRNQNLRSGRMG